MYSITFVTSHYRDQNDYGGQRSRVVSESLLKQGINVTSWVPIVDTLSGKKIVNRVENVQYIFTFPFTRRFFLTRLISQLVLALCFSIRKVDKHSLFVVNNNPPLVYLFMGLKLALMGRKYILDIRDYPFHKLYIKYPRLSLPLAWCEQYILQKRIGSISVSNGLRSSFGLTKKLDEVIELGFDDDKLLEFKKTFTPSSSKLVYIGSINSYFDLSSVCARLLEADFQGTLDYYGSSVQASLEQYKFFNNKGIVAKKELFKILNQYDAGIFPITDSDYTKYLLGNKVFDYLKSGLPIVVTGADDSDCLQFVHQRGLGFNFSDIDWNSKQEIVLSASNKMLYEYTMPVTQDRFCAYFMRLKNAGYYS